MIPVLRKIKVRLAVFIVLILSVGNVFSQDASDYAIHANIVYRFTKYVNWPESMKSGDFVIGFVGDTPLYEHLRTFTTNRSAGDQKIVLKKFTTSSPAYPCHILFVSDDESGQMKKIVAKTATTSTLIVTETAGLAKKGSCINFVIIQDRLKIEINKENIEQRKLGIATELLSLGKLVK